MKYLDYVPSETIVDQLLQLDDREIAMQLSTSPSSFPPALTQFTEQDDIIFTLSDTEAKDPNSVPEAQ